MICTEVGCDPTRGLDFRGFSRMVDDEEGRPVLNCVGKWRTGSRLAELAETKATPNVEVSTCP